MSNETTITITGNLVDDPGPAVHPDRAAIRTAPD